MQAVKEPPYSYEAESQRW